MKTFFSKIKQNLLGIIMIPIVSIAVVANSQSIYDNNSAVVLALCNVFIGLMNGLFFYKTVQDYIKYDSSI